MCQIGRGQRLGSFNLCPLGLQMVKLIKEVHKVLAELKELAVHLAEPWRSSLLWIPDDIDVVCNSVSYWSIILWDSRHGTVRLAGGSAQLVPPHWGQGLNHAIADVSNFVKAVVEVREGRKSREVAIEEYNTDIVKRGSDEVETSRKNTLLVLYMILGSLWRARCLNGGMQNRRSISTLAN